MYFPHGLLNRLKTSSFVAWLVCAMPLSAGDFSPASDWMKNGVIGLDIWQADRDMAQFMADFDIAHFADQCADMGVTFVNCQIGQNSGRYNAPNPVYETIAGYPVGSKCNPVDYPARFLQELAPRGMRMFLYVPSNPPENDEQARNNFLWPGTGYATPGWDTQNLWTQALQAWSDRYGPALAGWWFDGAYWTYAYDFNNLYGPRVTSGNANRMVCFNNGPGVRRVSGVETMTAGEMNSMHLLPRSRWVGGAQWFTYTYAGDSWINSPMSGHYSRQFITDYLGGLRERGGVMMLNVNVDDRGNIDPAIYSALVEARKALRDKNANRRVLRNSTGLGGVVYGGSNWQQQTGRDYGYWQPGHTAYIRRASLNEDTMKTDADGAWAEYTFEGTGVSYVGDRGSDKGEVDVYLDDVFQQRVNCGGSERWLQHLWSVTGLPKGTHRLKLVKVSGSWMEVDAFAVENPVVDPAVIPPFRMSAVASSEQPGAEASLVLDDDSTTTWHNLYNTPTTLPQSITLGLGGIHPVNKLRYLPRRDGGNGVITEWQIATSLDGITFTDVLTGIWANDVAEKTAVFPTVQARYVRLTATAAVNGFASAGEIRIEKDLSAVDPMVIDPATISITASSEQPGGGSAFDAADGDPDTAWRLRSGTVSDALPQHVLFDLVEVTDVRRLRYLPPQQGTDGIITAWTLSASLDGKVFTQIATGDWAADHSLKTIDFTARETRFLKFEATAGTGGTAAAAEFTVERAPVPTVTCPATQEIPMNTPTHSFVASVGDLTTAPNSLVLNVVSSDPNLIPSSGIVVSGLGADRTVSFTPSPYRHGRATLTLTVDNGQFTSTTRCVVDVLPIAPPQTTPGIIRDSTELWYDFNNSNKNVREALTTDASGNNRVMTGYGDLGDKWGSEGNIIVADGAAGWFPANAAGLPADNYQLVMQVNEPLPGWPSPHGDMDIATYDGIRIGYDNASTYTVTVRGNLLASQPGSGLWLKLVKLGGNLSFLTSPDGQSWTPRGGEIPSDAGSAWAALHLFVRPGGGSNFWGYFGDCRVDRISLQQTWYNQSGNWLWSPWVHNWSGSDWGQWKSSSVTDAVFGAEGAGPITVTEPLRVRNLTFSAPGYDLSGGKLIVPDSTITAGSDVMIRNAIDGAGSLTKAGAGSLTLAGDITCSGDIVVSDGPLILAPGAGLHLALTSSGHNRITGPGTVQFHGALVIDTSALASPAAGSLWQLVDTASRSFGPTLQVEGFTPLGDGIHWLKPAAGLNQWVFSESTGALTLEISDYASWSSTTGVTSAEADDDHDGLSNFDEYAFGLLPNDPSSGNPIAVPFDKATGKFSYTRRAASLTRLTCTIWYSTDLATWTRDTGATQGAPVLNGEVETVEVSLTPALLTNPKLFIQVRAN